MTHHADRYRADIDGLRAIAVLSVLFFHVGFNRFSGGYVGVDVFFVISGFLITGLIRDEVRATGSFNFSNFYLRRARRLFPSLFFTLMLCSGVAFALLSPQHLRAFGESLAATLAFGSNIVFWRQSGYFDVDATFKPLLHTWSLSVEEQFYLVWPMMLVVLLKKGHDPTVRAALMLAGLASLAANIAAGDGLGSLFGGMFADGRATIFYLAPFRVFEFAIGALIVWAQARRPGRTAVREVIVGAGLALIGYSVFAYTERTLFPSVAALVPAVGSALVIFGGPTPYAGSLLTSRAAVGIGLISYSLYLIHWPILVFYKYAQVGEIGGAARFGICGASIVAAVAMYKGVEQPFRGRRAAPPRVSLPAFAMVAGASAVLIVATSASVLATGGWPSRFSPAMQHLIALGDRVTRDDVRTWSLGRCYLGGSFAETDTFPADFDAAACLEIAADRNVVVLGDSSAASLMHGLGQVYPEINFIQITAASCRPIRDWSTMHGCDRMIAFAFDEFLPAHLAEIDAVLLVGRWYGDSSTFERLLATIATAGIVPREKLHVFGDQLYFRGGMSTAAVPLRGPAGFVDVLERIRVKYERGSNRDLRRLVEAHALFVEPHSYLCSPTCEFFIDGSMADPITRDGNHLTPNGSVLFAQRMRRAGVAFR